MNNIKKEMTERAERLNEMLKDEEFKIAIRDCFKNNGMKTAFVLNSPDRNASPSVYQETVMSYPDDNELLDVLRNIYRENRTDNVDMEKMVSRENILSTVKPKLVSKDNIENVIENELVYERYLDMLVLYYIEIEEFSTEGMTASYTLKEVNLACSGISIEELHDVALKNIEKDYFIRNMSEVICEIMGMSPEEMEEETAQGNHGDEMKMLVISTASKTNGASAILSDRVLGKISEKMEGDYYIIPSSIHECIAIPSDEVEPDEIRNMVMEVNDSQLEPEDRLTYSVYGYINGKLDIMQ